MWWDWDPRLRSTITTYSLAACCCGQPGVVPLKTASHFFDILSSSGMASDEVSSLSGLQMASAREKPLRTYSHKRRNGGALSLPSLRDGGSQGALRDARDASTRLQRSRVGHSRSWELRPSFEPLAPNLPGDRAEQPYTNVGGQSWGRTEVTGLLAVNHEEASELPAAFRGLRDIALISIVSHFLHLFTQTVASIWGLGRIQRLRDGGRRRRR